MSANVDFCEWGPIWLGAGQEELRWFTWIFDEDHWSLMQAHPWGQGPGTSAGRDMVVQIVEQWIERDNQNTFRGRNITRHWCRIKNRGTASGTYYPQAIVAPGRY